MPKTVTLMSSLLPYLPEFRQGIQRRYEATYRKVAGHDPHHYGDGEPDPQLERYQQNFVRHLGSYKRSASLEEVMRAARRSQVVYVGDFHPWRSAKDIFIKIVTEGASPGSQRIILLEEFQPKHDKYLKAYLKGEITDTNGLRARTWAYDRNGTWGGVLAIVDYAEEQEIPVKGIDVRFYGGSLVPLPQRTKGIAAQVERYIHDGEQIFILAGEFHLASNKLPAELGSKVKSSVTIFQGPDEMFWKLLPHGLAYGPDAVLTSTGVYCLRNSNPLFRAMVQQSAAFLRNDPERSSKQNLEIEYKSHLINVVGRALRMRNIDTIKPDQVPLADLERLVYGNDDKSVVRAKLKEWVSSG